MTTDNEERRIIKALMVYGGCFTFFGGMAVIIFRLDGSDSIHWPNSFFLIIPLIVFVVGKRLCAGATAGDQKGRYCAGLGIWGGMLNVWLWNKRKILGLEIT